MMKKVVIIISSFILLLSAMSVSAQEKQVFVPEKSFAIGAQIAHVQLDSDNSDIMLLINPLTARGTATLIAPFAEFSYKDDRAVGLRVNFFTGSLELDQMTLDLLNEGMQFDIDEVEASTSSFGASVYHRKYYGIDKKNRLGAYTEFALTASSGSSDFKGETDHSSNFKIKLSFSPGVQFFIMDNVAATFSVSIANVSYNTVKCFSDGVETGKRSKFGSRIGPDLTGVKFGVSFYF